MLMQKFLGFASFRMYDFAGFRKLFFAIAVFRNISQYFAIAVSQRYRKVSQIDFARFRKRENLVFFARFRNGQFADVARFQGPRAAAAGPPGPGPCRSQPRAGQGKCCSEQWAY